MTDIEVMKHAKDYVDQLANGINPLTGEDVGEHDVVNNIRISRCLFYVSKVLEEVIENGGAAPVREARPARPKREPFALTAEDLKAFRISETPIPVSTIVEQLNAIKPANMYRLFVHRITNGLEKLGYFEETPDRNGRTRKIPTEKGSEIGITCEERENVYGKIFVNLYNTEAQRFVLDHLDEILAASARVPAPAPEED